LDFALRSPAAPSAPLPSFVRRLLGEIWVGRVHYRHLGESRPSQLTKS
jgi:hypothetical protein